MFADDTQLLKSYNIEDSIKAFDEINSDLNTLFEWCEKILFKIESKKIFTFNYRVLESETYI